jgi:hypothetical protein
MTISSQTPHNLALSSSSSNNLCQLRRDSLQPPSCLPRRSSSSSISKVKIPTEKASERFLQSKLQCIDKRRRYLRRGSKTSYMLRGSFRVELPNLDDSIESCSSNSTWTSTTTSSSTSTMSIVSLELSESDNKQPSPTYMDPSQDMETTMHRRLQQERLSPPFFYPEQRRRNRKESTVSLLASALALSSLHDSSNDQSSLGCTV